MEISSLAALGVSLTETFAMEPAIQEKTASGAMIIPPEDALSTACWEAERLA